MAQKFQTAGSMTARTREMSLMQKKNQSTQEMPPWKLVMASAKKAYDTRASQCCRSSDVLTRSLKNYEGTSEHTYKDIKNSDGNGEYLLRVTCHYPYLSLF